SKLTYSKTGTWQGNGNLPGPGSGDGDGSDAGSAEPGGSWSISGTADETGNGNWTEGLLMDRLWSTVVHGHSISGIETTDYNQGGGYNYTAERELTSSGAWTMLSGSGSGSAGGHETITRDASGGYSYQFDNGAGTVSGMAYADQLDH